MSEHTPNGTPFCWVPKAALATIEQRLELPQAGSAKLVYLALCRVACEERSATFSRPIGYLAALASLERRTVERRLPDLEQLKLVRIERGAMHVPHTYTLTTLSRNDTTLSRNDATWRDPQRVALSNRSREVENGGSGLSVPERIALERKIDILRAKLEALRGETSERWQRQQNPQKVKERQALEAQLETLEARLLNA